ncbi:type II secretion system F family protein [Flavobacterium pallidum]|uniref:Type II secretion system F family protein n=1 Tax=Flavobacterium pallidum TaxID=2172098 RepID=A0A2S1SFT8_9FLAO|nr:type II secretion system F family protein [Flavobacterium pallidum]AWI25276.1 type II secretion system F family protein [Flavobacterium pallidum]
MAFKLKNTETAPAKSAYSGIDTLLRKDISLFGSRLSSKQKYDFYNELSILLPAGVTIKDALDLIKENQKKDTARSTFSNILEKVIAGSSLSEAIRAEKHFTAYEFFSIKIGEETGALPKICHRLAIFFERRTEQKKMIMSALTYPMIVLSTAAIVVIFMLSFVVPMFEGLFSQNNIELPYITKVIISISDGIKYYGWIIVLLIFGLIFLLKFMLKKENIKEAFQNGLLHLPVIGKFLLKIYMSQFMQAVSLLSSAKFPILNSLQIVRDMIGFMPLKKALRHAEEQILKGQSLSESLKGNKIFDHRILALIKIAEETNQTDLIFSQLNEQLNSEVVRQSKLIATFIEPLIILIVGVIVGFLLIGLYLPMFELSNVIK